MRQKSAARGKKMAKTENPSRYVVAKIGGFVVEYSYTYKYNIFIRKFLKVIKKWQINQFSSFLKELKDILKEML